MRGGGGGGGWCGEWCVGLERQFDNPRALSAQVADGFFFPVGARSPVGSPGSRLLAPVGLGGLYIVPYFTTNNT